MEIEHLVSTTFDLSALFDMTPDLVCIAGKDGYFKKINPAVVQKLGYTEQELFARPIFDFMHPDDRSVTLKEREKLLNGKTMLNFENRYLTKAGETVWLEWTSIYFPEKEVVFAVAKDVTARKRSEIDILEKYTSFKNLASYFKTSMEEDRKYLASEIHEELAQLTYAMRLDIDWMLMTLPQMPAEARQRIENVSGLSHLLITTMRKMAFELYPNMLDELGLEGSLQWLCKEFTAINGIPCVFKATHDEEKLPAEYKVDFFRICQEALSNVMYHAEATEVQVHLWNHLDSCSLLVADDGKGFEVQHYEQSAGMVSMRKRATFVNGQLKIDSKPGKGSRVCFTITLT